jgi:hypothetical protein
LQIKANYKTPNERHKAQCHQKPKYHEGCGKSLKRFGDRWTKQGREYYKELCLIFKNLKAHDYWSELQVHWKIYQKKNYNVSDDMPEDTIENDNNKEEEDSDEDNWKINKDDNKKSETENELCESQSEDDEDDLGQH